MLGWAEKPPGQGSAHDPDRSTLFVVLLLIVAGDLVRPGLLVVALPRVGVQAGIGVGMVRRERTGVDAGWRRAWWPKSSNLAGGRFFDVRTFRSLFLIS